MLADTAIVGHLGVHQLAALGLAGAVLSALFGIFNFLSYATTAQVARFDGAGRRSDADEVAGQALWLSLAIGIALLLVAAGAAVPIVSVMGGSGQTGHFAVTYLRIAAIGLPFVLVTLAGQGYLRGVSNLRLPLLIVVAGNVVNIVLEVLFVYGFHWGIAGSAAGTAIAQAGMGSAFAWHLFRAAGDARAVHRDRMLRLLRTGGHIFVRTTALLLTFVFGSAVSMVMVLIYTHLGHVTLTTAIVVNVLMFVGIFSRMIPSQALISAIPEPSQRGSFSAVSSSVQQFSGGLGSVLAAAIIAQNADGSLRHFDWVGYVVVATTMISVVAMYFVQKSVARQTGDRTV